MSERCCWPSCQQAFSGTIRCDNKVFRLCNQHGSLVQSETTSVRKRSRKKAGMPVLRKISGTAVTLTDPRSGARCAVDGCGHPLSLVVYTPLFPKESGGVPVCSTHYKDVEEHDVKWNGTWYKFLPACKLDRVLLFGNNEEVPCAPEEPAGEVETEESLAEGKTLVEVFAEEELTERESGLVSDLMSRLEAGELDAD